MLFQYQGKDIPVNNATVVIQVDRRSLEGIEIKVSFRDNLSTRCVFEGRHYYISGFDASDKDTLSLDLTPVDSLTTL